ncbi:hypothetical protein NQ318_020238, partial [Aromia moschata]
ITKLKIDSNPFAKGFRDSSRLTEFERETMESMLAEQHYFRSPLRPFAELDTHNNNLSLEEKAILAARSQLFLRAAAAAAGPYAPLMGGLYGAGASQGSPRPPPASQLQAPISPLARPLAQHRYSPYAPPQRSSPDTSLRDDRDSPSSPS